MQFLPFHKDILDFMTWKTYEHVLKYVLVNWKNVEYKYTKRFPTYIDWTNDTIQLSHVYNFKSIRKSTKKYKMYKIKVFW